MQLAAALHARAHAIDRLAALLLKHGDTGVTVLPSGRDSASASPSSTSSEYYGDSERTLAAALLQQQRQKKQQKKLQQQQQQQQQPPPDGADAAADAPWQHRTRSAILSVLPAHSLRPAVQQQQRQTGQPAAGTHPPHCNVPGCKHCQYKARWHQVREVEGGQRQMELLGLLLRGGGGPDASRDGARAAGGRRLAWGRDSNSG